MEYTLQVDKDILDRARRRAEQMGKSLEESIRDYLQTMATDNPERSIAEMERLSGEGSRGQWRFNRDEIHER